LFILLFQIIYYYRTLYVQAQLQQQQPLPTISLKITSPVTNQVPVGRLTISGTSTDNTTSDCTVYTNWNNTKPFQKAVATGKGEVNDYSNWTFTYSDKYHLITNGTNNLTFKLSCLNNNNGEGTVNLTTYYSLDITGIMESSQGPVSSVAVEEQQNNLNSGSVSFSLSPVKEDNNNTKTAARTTTTTSPESTPSVPITPSPDPKDTENTIIYWDI
jgi:hypothetical protein